MALYGASTEYVLHSLLWLVDHPEPVSSLDLAQMQGIPPAFMAKLLPRLEKAAGARSRGFARWLPACPPGSR
ncbi:Rrf2 family transcriptional regulator [Acetobacter okinawensis]|uniref:Rrf2 family transcriptional regulator n=1 Tax=Acetobacter okinawensis TaxID=1076594 RepID=UPI000ADAC1AE|nr:Rrf2 family transcriptional regulator [Acetobacter okinawensis]